jgi:hypothetical protein
VPLSFETLSHGHIAFGFFNIESDMLLCDRYFVFADEFCKYVEDIAENNTDPDYQTYWKVHFIETADAIGDLMGAIHGVRYTGFIGDLYRCFPFPARPDDFRQNPNGFESQSKVLKIISKYAEPVEIAVSVNNIEKEIQIGNYRFSRIQFQALIDYVWYGGYPRWKDESRPAYVQAMHEKLKQNRSGIFDGIVFSNKISL